MYRAIALKLLREDIEPESGHDLDAMLAATIVDFNGGRAMLDGVDVTADIRSADVTSMASRCSALPTVREKLVELQRAMGRVKSVVMDGRDIGTNVFPDAEYKFFLTASVEERAKRRYAEMTARGDRTDFDEVMKAIEKRDYDDSHRALNPLARADDAVLIDTDGIGIEEVTEKILSYMESS
jgi:cytidylate kinase